MIRKFWRTIEPAFLIVSAICSIISVAAICFQNKTATIIAISGVCISLIILLWAIIRVLNRFLEANPDEDYKCISHFIKYKTDDGENIECESHKLIQVKCSIMQYHDVRFKWSGNKFPKIESDLQEVEMTKSSKNATEYDTAKLRLRRPAMYNETTVIHFRSISNDSEHCSIPKYEIYVKYPIEFIQVEILLGYKDDNFNKTAIVERAKANTSMPQKYEHITSIPFNKNHKSYSHTFINPEPGYFYRILWER